MRLAGANPLGSDEIGLAWDISRCRVKRKSILPAAAAVGFDVKTGEATVSGLQYNAECGGAKNNHSD